MEERTATSNATPFKGLSQETMRASVELADSAVAAIAPLCPPSEHPEGVPRLASALSAFADAALALPATEAAFRFDYFLHKLGSSVPAWTMPGWASSGAGLPAADGLAVDPPGRISVQGKRDLIEAVKSSVDGQGESLSAAAERLRGLFIASSDRIYSAPGQSLDSLEQFIEDSKARARAWMEAAYALSAQIQPAGGPEAPRHAKPHRPA